MEPNIPTLGTRFTYTRFNETYYSKTQTIKEQWTGTVIRVYEGDIGEPTVETRRDDNGEIETFWNDSWNVGGLYELVEIL